MRPAEPILQIKNLRTSFFTDGGEVKAVDGVTLSIPKGDTVGVVGESGCGKSVMALSIMRLIEQPGRIVGGEILLHGEDLLKKSKSEMREIRGNKISMIFQEPMTSLNPVYTIGQQISEVYRGHQAISRRKAYARSLEMLKLVGIASPEKRMH